MTRLTHIPLTLAEANAFVAFHHRHHRPVVGHKFSLGAVIDGQLVGVAIIGRPVSRMRQDGFTLEVTRLCTDGTRNACSFLYGAAARAAFALGYSRIGTYTLLEEGGASLRGVGWKLIGERGGGSWNVPSRPRVDKHPTQPKLLWELTALPRTTDPIPEPAGDPERACFLTPIQRPKRCQERGGTSEIREGGAWGKVGYGLTAGVSPCHGPTAKTCWEIHQYFTGKSGGYELIFRPG
jgi:hypothetical protein